MLSQLPTEPISVAAFGSELVFPQFALNDQSSVAVYDTLTQRLTTFKVPQAAQGQFAYAVAPDLHAEVLWIGLLSALM